jgi:hypothetical protein
MGSSHRGKGAAIQSIDMGWLYRSPIPLGRKGAFYLPSRRLPSSAAPGTLILRNVFNRPTSLQSHVTPVYPCPLPMKGTPKRRKTVTSSLNVIFQLISYEKVVVRG